MRELLNSRWMSDPEVEEYGLVESIIRARADNVDGQLSWRYNVKWVGQSEEEASWLYDSDFDEQTQWIIDQFWANLQGGLNQRDYIEGDFVYAKQAWLEQLALVRGKQAVAKPRPQPPPRRRRQESDDSDDGDPFFRGKQRLKKRSSPPTRQFKATPLKQQKLDFSKASSSSKAADSSPPVASSSRLTQSKAAKAVTPAIVISSSSEDDTPTRPPPPASAASKPSRLRKLTVKASQLAATDLVHDPERRPSNGSTISAGARRQVNPVHPDPGRQRQPLRRSPTRPPSPGITLQPNGDGTLLTSSPVLSRPTALPATGHLKKGSSRPVPVTFHRSPPPRPDLPTISTPHNAVPDPPSAEAVVDLCTPSPEPPRKRVPSPPRTSAAKPKRPNPFASFAFDPSVHSAANGRPTKKRRLDADESPASSLPTPTARPVAPQAFRARNDFKSSRPSSSKTASALAFGKELATEPMEVVDLTASDELPPTHVPTRDGGRRARSPLSADFVPNGLLGFARQRGTPPAQPQYDSDLGPRTPPAPTREDMFASSIHSWSSPAVRSLAEHSPLRPNGLLSSAAKPGPRDEVREVEHTPLRPNGLLSSPTSAFARNGTGREDPTPLRPNGLLGASSSPAVSPVIEVHSSPTAKRLDELPSPESEEDDDEPFFRQPRPKTNGKTKPKSKSPPISPLVEITIEPEIVGPESYRERIAPPLGTDELAMPASYQSSSILELGPDYTIPVRLRDVFAKLPLPPRLLLQRAHMYDARHASKLTRVSGMGRVVPDPRTTSRPSATRQQCVWFLEFYRRLADGNKFLVLPESGDMNRGLVFASTQNRDLVRALLIPDGMRRYRHCVVVAKIASPDLVALPPPDEIFTFNGP